MSSRTCRLTLLPLPEAWLPSSEILYDKERVSSAQIQARLDSIGREHDDTFIEAIQHVFDLLKARHFDSSWKWVRYDAIYVFYEG